LVVRRGQEVTTGCGIATLAIVVSPRLPGNVPDPAKANKQRQRQRGPYGD
jgi:hypothetical protein